MPSPQTPAAPLVLCLGEALVDRLAASDGDRLGGAPANVACALARLGTPSAFLGRLGRDAIGQAFAAVFAERGVDTSALQWDAQRPSRVVLVQRDASGDRQFGGFVGAVGGAGASGVGASGAGASSGGGMCFADQALDAAELSAALGPLLQQAALIKCAAEEARWLFGSDDPAVLRAALPQYPDVVVTNGGAPLRWCVAGRTGELPAFRVPVVDTTGAGDAFKAGLLHGLLHNQPEPLLRFASACDALVCQGAGAIDPQPSAGAVCAFLMAN